jgi:hypothetical protein
MAETRKRVTFVCETCGSGLVTRDAWAEWDVEDQEWVLGAAYDYTFCHNCEVETHLLKVELAPEAQT